MAYITSAAGQQAHRLLFHCSEYQILPRCYAAFGPPANATYPLCHCHVLEIELRVQWFLITHRRQQQHRARLKIWHKPHHAHDADHRERPAVGSMQVKLLRLQKRKPDESLGWCDFPNEWWSSCSTRFSLSGNGLCMCVYLCVSACVLWLLGYDLSFWEKTIHFSLLYKGTWFNIVVINCLSSLISCSRESRA